MDNYSRVERILIISDFSFDKKELSLLPDIEETVDKHRSEILKTFFS